MPRNGSGTYTLPEAAFVDGTTINAAPVNSNYSDIASALTGSVASDGQTPMTGDLNMNGNDITNAAAITATGIVGAANTGRGALVNLTTSQSIAPGLSGQAVSWSGAVYDDATIWSGGSPTRLTVPAGFSRVQLQANIVWAANTTSVRRFWMKKNGSNIYGGGFIQDTNPLGDLYQNISSAMLAVSPGDYFEAFVAQITGGALNILGGEPCWFAIQLLR